MQAVETDEYRLMIKPGGEIRTTVAADSMGMCRQLLMAIGISTLRRDGFASLDAGASTGTITTRPVVFSGSRLFVNVDCPQGELKAEMLDEAGKPIEPFTLANCRPVCTNSTCTAITWKNATNLTPLRQTPVRFRFTLKRGSLYAFWVSRDSSGRSDGYVAGGGPGYTGLTDTQGTTK